MHLRKLLAECGPWCTAAAPARIAQSLESRWGGARVFMTIPAVKQRWRAEGRDPKGGAERLAADIEQAILDCGGEREHVERVLLACTGGHLFV